MFNTIVDVSKAGDDVLEREFIRVDFWRNLAGTFKGVLIVFALITFFSAIITFSTGDPYKWQMLTVFIAGALLAFSSIYTFKKANTASRPIEEECFLRAQRTVLAGLFQIIDGKLYDGRNADVIWQRAGWRSGFREVRQICKTKSGNWFEVTFAVSTGKIASEIRSVKPLTEKEARKDGESNPEIYIKAFGKPELA
jgi:hypothetical protein